MHGISPVELLTVAALGVGVLVAVLVPVALVVLLVAMPKRNAPSSPPPPPPPGRRGFPVVLPGGPKKSDPP